MTRTLLAFGDSHTAGAEIEKQYVYECFEKAYPALIAKHYGFNYENYAQSGGSNDWSFKKFNDVVKKIILKKENVFILFNFTQSSRTYIDTPHVAESNKEWDNNYYGKLDYFPAHLDKDFFFGKLRNTISKSNI